MAKKRKDEVRSVCPCCKFTNGRHDDWCKPDVRRDVASCVASDLPDGAYDAVMQEFDIDPC